MNSLYQYTRDIKHINLMVISRSDLKEKQDEINQLREMLATSMDISNMLATKLDNAQKRWLTND